MVAFKHEVERGNTGALLTAVTGVTVHWTCLLFTPQQASRCCYCAG
uniref:Uncharacterized protein n=1 Tax=Anguilla anguilla TaxID=7936 RepID=A0A0E9WR85_ANGAN